MKLNISPSGRSILILDPGERKPAPSAPDRRQTNETVAAFNARSRREYPSIVLRRRGDLYYQMSPATSDKRPRDPKTGDVAQRGNSDAQRERDSRRMEQKPLSADKGATARRAGRRRAPVAARSVYPLTSGGSQPIALNATKKRKAS